MNMLSQPTRTDQRILMVCMGDGHDWSCAWAGVFKSRDAFIMPKCQASGKGLTFKKILVFRACDPLLNAHPNELFNRWHLRVFSRGFPD